MDHSHEADFRPTVTDVGPGRFLPGSSIEIIREVKLSTPPRYALFDFDGTLSLIREGWPDVMVPMMVDALKTTPTTETDDQLAMLARTFVMELTGKQTIYQMIRLAEEVALRGGNPEDPLVYKHRYHKLLMERIEGRRESLRTKAAKPERMVVPFSHQALGKLQEHEVELFLASGTDEQFVREEVMLLGLDKYFGTKIYGAVDDYKNFSKEKVIHRILKENRVDGSRLIGFGDGYVEIENIKAAGGTAVAVASDEARRNGHVDEWKRARLIAVGADVVIPDFRDIDRLWHYLCEPC